MSIKGSSSQRKRIFYNLGWLFTDNIIKLGLGAVIGLFIAKELGPKEFGILSYALVYYSFFSAIVGLGLKKIVVREMSNDFAKSKSYIGTSFYCILNCSIIVTFLSPILLTILRPNDTFSLGLVTVLSFSFLFQAFSAFAFYFEARTDMKKVVISSNIGFFLGLIVKICGLLYSSSLYIFVWAVCIETAVAGLLLFYNYTKHQGGFETLSFNRQIAKKLLKDSSPLILSTLAVKIYADVDLLMIRDLFNDVETGRYAVAVKISRLLSFIPSAIFISVFPTLVKTRAKNFDVYLVKIQKLYALIVFISYCGVALTTLFSSTFLTYFLGESYSESAFFLIILVWSSLFAALGGARSLYLIGENKTRIYLFTVVVGCILNLILNYMFIPVYGAYAACVTTLITTFFSGIGVNFLIKELRETGTMQLKALVYPKFW